MQTSVVRIRPIRKNIRKSNWIISNLYGVNMNKNGLKPTPIVNEACSFKRFSFFSKKCRNSILDTSWVVKETQSIRIGLQLIWSCQWFILFSVCLLFCCCFVVVVVVVVVVVPTTKSKTVHLNLNMGTSWLSCSFLFTVHSYAASLWH